MINLLAYPSHLSLSPPFPTFHPPSFILISTTHVPFVRPSLPTSFLQSRKSIIETHRRRAEERAGQFEIAGAADGIRRGVKVARAPAW